MKDKNRLATFLPLIILITLSVILLFIPADSIYTIIIFIVVLVGSVLFLINLFRKRSIQQKQFQQEQKNNFDYDNLPQSDSEAQNEFYFIFGTEKFKVTLTENAFIISSPNSEELLEYNTVDMYALKNYDYKGQVFYELLVNDKSTEKIIFSIRIFKDLYYWIQKFQLEIRGIDDIISEKEPEIIVKKYRNIRSSFKRGIIALSFILIVIIALMVLFPNQIILLLVTIVSTFVIANQLIPLINAVGSIIVTSSGIKIVSGLRRVELYFEFADIINAQIVPLNSINFEQLESENGNIFYTFDHLNASSQKMVIIINTKYGKIIIDYVKGIEDSLSSFLIYDI